MANNNMKKMMNQAIFTRLLIGSDGKVTAEFAEPFTALVEPVKDEVAQYNSINNAEAREHLLTSFLSSIPNRLSKSFGKGWSKDFLVQEKGLEPSRHCCHRHLKPARLPIPPFLHELTKNIIHLFFEKVKWKIKKIKNNFRKKLLTDWKGYDIVNPL